MRKDNIHQNDHGNHEHNERRSYNGIEVTGEFWALIPKSKGI